MCSIAGFFSESPLPAEKTLGMLERTRHRGPDSVGCYLDGEFLWSRDVEGLGGLRGRTARVCLGQARLAIVGGESGRQPLAGCRPGWAIVVNGEVYNHAEIARLVSGHEVRTGSDSELLLHLIEELDQGNLATAVRRAMSYVDGMYAFAVTDGRTVVAARDPVGKKPLYFTGSGPMAFASERKALAPFGGPIRRLVPGGVLVMGRGRPRVVRTARFARPPVDLVDGTEALDAYRRAFARAVEKRVRGLGRVGVLFSGGVDSAMVAVAARQAGAEVTAFCVGLRGSPDIVAARESARALGVDVRCAELAESEIEALIPEVIEAIELNGLIQVEAAVPMYVAARLCAEDGHKVMLSGQAADELFAGYGWYPEFAGKEGWLALHERLWDDIEKLYLDTLEREDRVGMAHGIEFRAPFLDGDLIRVAMRMSPEGIKLSGPDDVLGKRVHRTLALELGVPEAIALRGKSRAQDGSGVHEAFRRIAGRSGPRPASPPPLDFGSNYRYVPDQFGGPEVSSYLADVTRRHRIGAIANGAEEDYETELVER